MCRQTSAIFCVRFCSVQRAEISYNSRNIYVDIFCQYNFFWCRRRWLASLPVCRCGETVCCRKSHFARLVGRVRGMKRSIVNALEPSQILFYIRFSRRCDTYRFDAKSIIIVFPSVRLWLPPTPLLPMCCCLAKTCAQ